MVRGHPDYWSGAFTAMPVLGEGQTGWFRAEENAVDGGDFWMAIEYTTPVGFELYVTGVIVSSNFPRTQRIEILYGEVYALSFVGVVYYNTTFITPINAYNRLVVPALWPVAAKVYNDDADSHGFSVSMVGFLQEKE